MTDPFVVKGCEIDENIAGAAGGDSNFCNCAADLNHDSFVSGADLGIVLGAWGLVTSPADLNRDGGVTGADLGLVLGEWAHARDDITGSQCQGGCLRSNSSASPIKRINHVQGV